MSGPTRASLLLRVRDPADAEAWSEFDRQYRDLILGYCFRRGLQFADADEVRQATMIALSRRLRDHGFDASLGRFRDYLGRIVVNAVANLRRQRARRPTVPLERAEGVEAPAELVAAWQQEWVDHHLRLALDRLRGSTEASSLAVFEALLAGEAAAAVAERFGMQVDAVYKVKQRVKERMQAEVARQLRESESPRVAE